MANGRWILNGSEIFKMRYVYLTGWYIFPGLNSRGGAESPGRLYHSDVVHAGADVLATLMIT